MPTVEFERTFQAAHRLSDYEGKCSRIHGHNFRIRVAITTERLGADGFVIDFDRVKELIDALDHRLILKTGDPIGDGLPRDWLFLVSQDPTTEFMAQWFAQAFAELIPAELALVAVEVLLRETDSIAARGTW